MNLIFPLLSGSSSYGNNVVFTHLAARRSSSPRFIILLYGAKLTTFQNLCDRIEVSIPTNYYKDESFFHVNLEIPCKKIAHQNRKSTQFFTTFIITHSDSHPSNGRDPYK